MNWYHWPPLERLLTNPEDPHQKKGAASYVRRLKIHHGIDVGYLKPQYANLECLHLHSGGVLEPDSDDSDNEHEDENDEDEEETVEDKDEHDRSDNTSTKLEDNPNQIIDFLRRHHAGLREIELFGFQHAPITLAFWELLADETLFLDLSKLAMRTNRYDQSYSFNPERRHLDQDTSAAFWRTCSRLRSLDLWDVRPEVPDSDDKWPEFPLMMRLYWNLYDMVIRDENLGSLEARGAVINPRVFDGLRGLARTGRLSNLTSIEVTPQHYNMADVSTTEALSNAIAAFLDSLSMTLESLTIYMFDLDARVFSSLRRHFETLTTMEVGMPDVNSSWTIQTILSSCPKLKSFRGDVVQVSDMMKGGAWACLGIQVLRLRFEVDDEDTHDPDPALRTISAGVTSTPPSRHDEWQLFALRQVSLLTQLKSLQIDGVRNTRADWEEDHGNPMTPCIEERMERSKLPSFLDLRLTKGLELLACLRNLECIWFQPGQVWTDAEVDWAKEHWPRLRGVCGLHPDEDEEQRLELRLVGRS
ncbi:hypothetical protein BGX28_002267 [Mortierella sp. GBA30]|nr:hypothetical protein BGX28_002267 [Mortierella sp. GBA30]